MDPPALPPGPTWHRGGVELLEENGFKKGETAYIEQKGLPLEVESV